MTGGDLILVGKGGSRVFADDYLKSLRDPEVWTLNDAGRKESSLHFDVHEDRRFWNHYDDVACAWVVSPFACPAAARPRMARFPLAECFQSFGRAYFECTLDYMLALALLQRRRGQRVLKRLWLPGFDMRDGRHYTFRPGAHFWLGVATGMGIEVKVPRPSLLLKRVVDMPPHPHGDPEFPHAYGQSAESSGPVAERYGWR